MEQSVLSVTIVEARDLKPSRMVGNANPYVMLSLGDEQKQFTEPIVGALNPVWNEVMSFDIVTGKEILVARVFDKADRIGQDTLIG